MLIPFLLFFCNLGNNTGNRTDKPFRTPITLRMVWSCPLFDRLNQVTQPTEKPRLKVTALVAKYSMRATEPAYKVVHDCLRHCVSLLIRQGIRFRPLCIHIHHNSNILVSSIGLGKWSKNVNLDPLQWITRLNGCMGALGRGIGPFLEPHVWHVWQYSSISAVWPKPVEAFPHIVGSLEHWQVATQVMQLVQQISL